MTCITCRCLTVVQFGSYKVTKDTYVICDSNHLYTQALLDNKLIQPLQVDLEVENKVVINEYSVVPKLPPVDCGLLMEDCS